MDSIKEDIHQELHRLRLDKKHIYGTLLKIIDALPQEAPVPVEVVEAPVPVEVVEAPVPVEKVEVVEKVEEVPPAKKSGGRKKKTLTVKA
jgi:hypothetical protein